jgi:predicted Rossmann fold nucleotide-binding protein DprA/Smf involved in DNA uptake
VIIVERKWRKMVAIIGNREGWSSLEVSMKLDVDKLVTKDDIIVSGGAEGVDSYAQLFAKKHGIPILIIYPDLKKPSPQRFYERNEWIAEISDIIIAFNLKNNNGKSGTMQTVNFARKLNKKVIVIEK